MGDTTPDRGDKAPGATAGREADPPYVPGQRPRNAWVAPGSSEIVQEPSDHGSSGSSEPTRRRRLLSRIPGLSRLAEQSGWIRDGDAKAPTSDPGWVFHEGGEPGAFQGWLYHYADGTVVDADGTQYAVPGDETAAERDADATPEHDAGAGEQSESPGPSQEGPEDEAREQVQEEPKDAGEPHQPEPVPEAKSQPERKPPPDQSGPVAGPATAATSTPPTAAPKAVEKGQPGKRMEFPRFVEYSPTNLRGYLLGSVFLIAAVAGVLTAFVALSEDSTPALVIAGCCGVLALVSAWALSTWQPTVVSIRDGVLRIGRGDHSDRFELEDPSTVVEFSGRPGSPAWSAMVKHTNGPRTILRPSHVKPRQFERIVRYHRARQRPPSDGETED